MRENLNKKHHFSYSILSRFSYYSKKREKKENKKSIEVNGG